jgi:hypothetical protein
MAIIFKPDNHLYVSTDEVKIDWISVTSLIGNLKPPFNGPAIAARSSKSKKSKWYGMSVEDILAAWKCEGDRAITLGTWYHNQRESDICGLDSLSIYGREVPVFKPCYDDEGNKMAPAQKLVDGIYPEHLVYLKSAGIIGQSDLVEVVDGVVNITDYKTNKEIKTESYVDREGFHQKMLHPVKHLDDCNLNHYNLQLSTYLFMILKHNPKLRPGKLTLHHITFEEEGRDKYDYPIAKRNEFGEPIVKEVIPYVMPYLRQEVISIIHWLADNRHKLKKKS